MINKMAMESVEAVRQAERHAAQTEKDAAQRQQELIAQAEADARTRIGQMTSNAQAQAQKELQMAQEKADALLSEARESVRLEINRMNDSVKDRERAAVELVMSAIA